MLVCNRDNFEVVDGVGLPFGDFYFFDLNISFVGVSGKIVDGADFAYKFAPLGNIIRLVF